MLFDNELQALPSLVCLVHTIVESVKRALGVNKAARRKLLAHNDGSIRAVVHPVARAYLGAEEGLIGIDTCKRQAGALFARGLILCYHTRLLASILMASH